LLKKTSFDLPTPGFPVWTQQHN